jgi:nucleotide-binding universal stress UspA family protein
MESSNKKNKIIWSVDPTQDPAEAKNIIKELKIWAKHLNCEVQPVSIFSKSTLNVPIEMAFPWKEKLQEVAQKSITRFLKKTQAKGFLLPELVFVPALSNRKLASEMAKYAEKRNAQLIFANTRAKKTWNPFRLGGFAETLVATSRVPVLLLNPSSVPSSKIPSILFPTDFSKDSKNAIVKLEPWAKAFNSKILLYDQVETPNIYPSDFSGIGHAQARSMESMIKDVEKSRLKKGAEWTNLLEKQNIKSSLLVQRQRKYLAADILEAAKKNRASLIAIASRSGPVAQALLGSVARDILLQAKCPVLIFYRPKASRKHATQSKQKANRKYLAPKDTSLQTEVRHG